MAIKEDCISSLWKNGVVDDILYLIYLMNRRSNIVIRTPFGNARPFNHYFLSKTRYFTILNNSSLDEVCAHSNSYQHGTVKIKTLEFVDDIADPNNGSSQALVSHKIITYIIQRKQLKLPIDKCKQTSENHWWKIRCEHPDSIW